MSRMFKRWLAWKALDDGAQAGTAADAATRRLDEALRRGAVSTIEEPSGRVAQRVVARIQSVKWTNAAEEGPMRLWGWTGIAAAACLGVIVWTFVMTGLPQGGSAILGPGREIARKYSPLPDLDKWSKPAVDMLVWLDEPMMHEAKSLERDALRAAAFVRGKFPARASK